MSNNKVYFNGIKKARGLQFGTISLSISVEDFIKELQAHKNSAGYVNILVKERKSPDKFGNDRYVVLDDWKPNKASAPTNSNSDTDDLPF